MFFDKQYYKVHSANKDIHALNEIKSLLLDFCQISFCGEGV